MLGFNTDNKHTGIMPYLRRCSVLSLSLWTSALSADGKTIYITAGPDYYPLTDKRQPDGGEATRIVSAVFRNMGQPVEIRWLPWRRGFEMTKAGKFHATFPYMKTAERHRDFLYSDVLITEESFLWTRIGSPFNIDNMTTFKGAKLCTGIGYVSVLEDILKPMVEGNTVKIDRPINIRSCILMLAAGRVDAVSGPKDEILPIIEQKNLADQVTHSAKPLRVVEFHLIAAQAKPESSALIRRFNISLRQMREDGSYRRLLDR